MSTDWNKEAIELSNIAKAKSRMTWDELAQAMSEAFPDEAPVKAGTLRKSMSSGSYNIRTLLKLCASTGLEVTISKNE